VTDLVSAPPPDVARYALALGDDALILSHRLGEWSASAPEIEEDLALTNLALDLLGQARTLLTRAGELLTPNRSEDDLAFLRSERELTNALLVEHPNVDFAHTIIRQLLFSTYQLVLYERLQASSDEVLAGLGAKAVKEVAYHREHARAWTLRLGDGTQDSHRRAQVALDALWPYADELFARRPEVERLASAGVAVDPSLLRPLWEAMVRPIVEQATLVLPDVSWRPSGGRDGRHTEALGFLLAEMQSLHRAHPGATW
jgi:ring-1,2-phenylacetyl-CoA epoxidase subunit PaaC